MKAKPFSKTKKRWMIIWTLVAAAGSIIFLIGINPGFFNLDRSRTVGFVQIGMWSFGLGVCLIGLYALICGLRNGRERTLRSDIGSRLIATGYVLAVAASYADFIGIGTHELEELLFGPLQVIGLAFAGFICLIGLVLFLPARRTEEDTPDNNVKAME